MKAVSSIAIAETVEGAFNQVEAEEVDFKVVKKRKRGCSDSTGAKNLFSHSLS